MKIKNILLAFLFFFVNSFLAQAQKTRPQDFIEFEELVSGPMPLFRDRIFVPDYRRMFLEHAKRFEAFLDKYQGSLLRPEALLRTAWLYLNVERQEVHMFRQELFFCQASAIQLSQPQKMDICQQRYMLNVTSMGGMNDPAYAYVAKQILNQLVEQYPRAKRYIMIDKIGEFSFDEEEIGAFALYLLAKGELLEDQRKTYELIIREYKIRPELLKEIKSRLGGNP